MSGALEGKLDYHLVGLTFRVCNLRRLALHALAGRLTAHPK